MKNRHLLATTIFARPIVAFAGTMPPVPYGSQYVNSEAVTRLIEAAEIAADQQIPTIVIDDDLEARDESSQWMLCYWDLADDLTDGYDAVKARSQKYLPKFTTENEDEYQDRLALTEFTNVYRDSIETLSSKPFEEPVVIVKPKETKDGKPTGEEMDLPDEIIALGENVDGSGNNLTTFAGHAFFNGINSAIHWIYVDYPKVDTSRVISKAQAKAENLRPFWSHILGRNVLEAKTIMINGVETLIYIRILEPGSPNHIRIFNRYFDGTVIMGLYEQKIIDSKKKQYILVDVATISIGEIPLVYFATGRRDGRTFKFAPPMRDAADLQVQCYQKESGAKYCRTLAMYPMLTGNGIKPEMGPDNKPKPIRIGPAKVVYSPPDGIGNHGEWKFISPDAAVMKFLKDDIKDTQEQLRELGRQPLTAQSNNLTVITTAYAAGKAKTAVGAWAYLLQDALENAMRLSCLWLGITEEKFEPEIKVFTDFDDFATDQAADLTVIQSARDKRDLSQKGYHRELKRRGTLRAEFDTDENTRELLEETPSDLNPDGTPNDGANPPAPGNNPIPKKPQPPKKPVKP